MRASSPTFVFAVSLSLLGAPSHADEFGDQVKSALPALLKVLAYDVTHVGARAALAKRLFALQSEASRIGFEASNQYSFVPLDLVEKILNCRYLLGRPRTSRVP